MTFYLNYLEEIYTNLSQTMDSMSNTLKNIKRFGSVFFDYEDLLKKEDKYSHLQPWQDILRIVRTGELSASFHKFVKERFEAKHILDANSVLLPHPRNLRTSSITFKRC